MRLASQQHLFKPLWHPISFHSLQEGRQALEFTETQYPDSADEADMDGGLPDPAVGGETGAGQVGGGAEDPPAEEGDVDDYDIPMSPEGNLAPQGGVEGPSGADTRWQHSVRVPLL